MQGCALALPRLHTAGIATAKSICLLKLGIFPPWPGVAGKTGTGLITKAKIYGEHSA